MLGELVERAGCLAPAASAVSAASGRAAYAWSCPVVTPVRARQSGGLEVLLLPLQLGTELEDALQQPQLGAMPLQPFAQRVLGRDDDTDRPGPVERREQASSVDPGEEGADCAPDCSGRQPSTRTCSKRGDACLDRPRRQGPDLRPPVSAELQPPAGLQVVEQCGREGVDSGSVALYVDVRDRTERGQNWFGLLDQVRDLRAARDPGVRAPVQHVVEGVAHPRLPPTRQRTDLAGEPRHPGTERLTSLRAQTPHSGVGQVRPEAVVARRTARSPALRRAQVGEAMRIDDVGEFDKPHRGVRFISDERLVQELRPPRHDRGARQRRFASRPLDVLLIHPYDGRCASLC